MVTCGPVSEGLLITRNRNKRLPWPKLLLLAAAMAGLLFLGTGASFLHQDAPGTFCSICYAAHIPALRSAPARIPVTSSAVAWLLPTELPLVRAAPETLSSAPRAPPA
jgi:hypothetical protein